MTRVPKMSRMSHFLKRMGWRSIPLLAIILFWGVKSPIFAQVSFGGLADNESSAPAGESGNQGKGKKKKAEKKTSRKKGNKGSSKEKGEKGEDSAEPAILQAPSKGGPVLGRAKKQKYRIGMSLEARPNGECSDIFGSVPIPTNYHDQTVRLIEEEYPRGVRIDYRNLKDGECRQMIMRMKTLKPGEKAEVTVTLEVTRFEESPPENKDAYSIPKPAPKEVRDYLKESPFIEVGDRRIKKMATEAFPESGSDWSKVDSLLKYVRDQVKYKEAYKEKEIRGAIAELETGEGDCEDMSALFIALCRANGIPARTVRVPEHCWAEFYLEDESKNGFWFPAQVAGNEPLGVLTDLRMILQKGDAFKIPEKAHEVSRYVTEHFSGSVKMSGQDPIHEFIREEIR